MYNRILVAIDGSENSYKALDHAVAIANKFGSELTILATIPSSIMPIFPSDEFGIAFVADELISYNDNLKIITQDIVNKAFTKVRSDHPNLNINTTLREGLLHKIIIDISEKVGYDLIVIFSPDISYIARLLLGNISQRIIASCKKPILIIK